MSIETRPLRPAADTEPTHAFIGNPIAGPCVCGRPFASPIHHHPRHAPHPADQESPS